MIATECLARSPQIPGAMLDGARERVIVIRGVQWNLDLRALHDALYGEPRWDDVVRFIFAEDALFLSRHPDLPALRTGSWPKMHGGML